jgi:two-component system NtrC family sensor kinase
MSQKIMVPWDYTLHLPRRSVMEAPTTPHLTILVVEDEANFAKALATLLSRDGHTVETADNGRRALVQVHARRYDLILCDLRLPELDGQALYHLLKAEAPDMHQRVIFLTGDTLNPRSIEFLEQHHLLWLPKPCSAAQVRAVMQHALRHAT